MEARVPSVANQADYAMELRFPAGLWRYWRPCQTRGAH